MSDYEKLRQKRVEENKLRVKGLGINTMAYEVNKLMMGSKHPKKNKVQSKKGELDHKVKSNVRFKAELHHKIMFLTMSMHPLNIVSRIIPAKKMHMRSGKVVQIHCFTPRR